MRIPYLDLCATREDPPDPPTTPLRYDWLSPIWQLENLPGPHAPAMAMRIAAIAREFVARWADWAEMVGMTPAHLMSYPMGLAWQWTDDMEIVCFPKRGYLVTELTEEPAAGLLLVWRFTSDGRCVLVDGDDRERILSGYLE